MTKQLDPQDLRVFIDALCKTPPFVSERERRVLVHHALGDYPQLAEILHWQDWSGSAMVVADELVRRLDGVEPVPGVAALGLLGQAIEPLVGGGYQARLEEIRRRHRWGLDPAPAASKDWNDDRPAAELIRERIIGENTLRNVSYLEKALCAAQAVVRIAVHRAGTGTGFLISPDLMLTNHHVIADQAQADRAEIRFFYQFAIDDSVDDGVAVRAASRGLLLTSPETELDVSVLRLAEAPRLDHYPALRPALLQRKEGEADPRVAIIQHPGGGLKKISLQNNLVCYSDTKLLQYYTSTQSGSSGSPVFDDDFNVVAIHHGTVKNPEWQQTSDARPPTDPKRIEELQLRNQGTSMIAVVNWLRTGAPDLLSAVAIRD